VPLETSITQGLDVGIVQNLQSRYRKPLREELRYRGYDVNMVGSRAQGDFSNNQHEGWPGYEIDQVVDKMLPILTTLPPTREATNDLWIKTANSGYKELAQEIAKQGRKIEFVDMYSTRFLPEEYSDSIHFKPPGYKKMAALFAGAFSQVEAKGWLSTLLETRISDSIGCCPNPNNFHGPSRTQKGSGHDDGDFTYESIFERSIDLEHKQSVPRALLGHVRFANLIKSGNEGQALNEFIRVFDREDRAKKDLPLVLYHTNKGDANFEQVPVPIDKG
jgi:hypothetical protein